MNNKNSENCNEMFNTVFQLLGGSVGMSLSKNGPPTNPVYYKDQVSSIFTELLRAKNMCCSELTYFVVIRFFNMYTEDGN